MSLVSTNRRHSAVPQGGAPQAYERRQDGAVEIAQLWRVLWHRKFLIAAIVAAFAALTLAYGLTTPSLYTASSQILIDPRDRNVVSNDVNPSTLSPDGGIAQVESQASVIQSTGVLVRAIRAANLTRDTEFNSPGLLGRLFGALSPERASSNGELSDAEARTLSALRRKLSVRRADKVLVVDVVITTHNPDKSALIANAIAEAYLADQADSRSRSAQEASAGLTARLAEQRKRVEAAENAVETYRAQNNLVAASGRLISDQQLTEISNQLSTAQARTAQLKAQVEQITQQRQRGGLAGSSSEALLSTVISRLREQEATLVQREADLQSQLGPRHPSIAAVRSQLTHIRQLITTEISRVEQSARADYDRARANEKLLSERFDTLSRQTRNSDQASVRLRDLQRDLEAVRAVYATFLQRAQEIREQSTLDTTNARIISLAQAPQQKSWPAMGLLLAGAIGLGLGLGAGSALILEYASPTLLSVTQAEAAIGAPVIGVLRPEQSGRKQMPWRKRIKEPAPPPGGDAHSQAIAGLALLRLFDGYEASRAVARSILLISTASDDAERLRAALLLTDASAARGDRVLLVDADVEQKRDNNAAGLLDVLRGDCSLREAVRHGASTAIAMMPAGRHAAGPQKQNGRQFATRMLAEASRQFDVVFFDGGVPTANVKIAPLISTVEQVIVVAQLNRTKQKDLDRVVEATGIMGRKVTAVLLVDPMGHDA